MESKHDWKDKLNEAVKSHSHVFDNITRRDMIQEAIDNGEAIIAEGGALATWTPIESTGRSPKDTVIVKRPSSEKNIDWNSPNNIPIDEETFDIIFSEALTYLDEKEKIYVTDRVVGADVRYALPVKMISY